MRALVVLAVLGVCSAVPLIGDTPEVAAEKARFFQAYRAAQAAAQPEYNAPVPQQANSLAPVQPKLTGPEAATIPFAVQVKWTGPVAATIPAGINGIIPVSDTNEVSAARSQFFNAYQAQLAATVGVAPQQAAPAATVDTAPQQAAPAAPTFSPAPIQPKWTGPVATTIPAGINGIIPVSDTNEVSAARSQFFNAYQAQLAATVGVAPQQAAPAAIVDTAPQQAAPVESPAAPTFSPAPVQPKWTGPVAATIPAGVPGSSPQVPDTPEVAAAKQTFFSAYQKQVAAAAPAS